MLPLAHRRVLVLRAAGQGSGLAQALEALGASVIHIPAIEIAPPHSYCAMDAALASVRSFDWLIVTSPNAVQAFVERAGQLRIAPQARRVAAIGASTARAVAASGLAAAVDLVPPQAVAESLAEALTPHAPGASMLLVRAAAARDVLPDRLREAGAILTIAEAYRNVVPPASSQQLRELFTTDPPDAIAFTSGSTADNLSTLMKAAGVKLPEGIVLASIGPVTSAAMRELGWQPAVEAAEASVSALAEALGRSFPQ